MCPRIPHAGTEHPAKGRLPHPAANFGSANASVHPSTPSVVAQSLTDGFSEHGADIQNPHDAPESADSVDDSDAGGCRAAAMRRAEFARLDGTVYADHAGTTLYTDRQLQEVYQVPYATMT